MSVLFVTVSVSILTYFTDNYNTKYGEKNYTYMESIMYLFGLLFQRDIGGLNPRTLGSRVISITVALAFMIVMSTYTAVLTLNAVTHVERLPITGFMDPKVSTNLKKVFKHSPMIAYLPFKMDPEAS